MDNNIIEQKKETYIWLAIEDPITNVETHMKWEGHTKVENAKKELNYIIGMIRKRDGKYPNTYVYEAEEPPYGIKGEIFDLSTFDKLGDILSK